MTTPKHELCGVLPVFQTPWHDDETLDLDTLEHEITWLYDCGANGIVMAMVLLCAAVSGVAVTICMHVRAHSGSHAAGCVSIM